MKEITFVSGVSKERASRIKDFMVKADKFLDHTGLSGEGYFCTGFDPGYHFAGPDYRHTFIIDALVMDRIIKVLENG